MLETLSTDSSSSQEKMGGKSMMAACVLQLQHHKYLALYLNSLAKLHILLLNCFCAKRTPSSLSGGSSDDFTSLFSMSPSVLV